MSPMAIPHITGSLHYPIFLTIQQSRAPLAVFAMLIPVIEHCVNKLTMET